MLISLNWIKDFSKLPLDISPEELGLRLTMGTAEVENVEVVNGFWKAIKVVEVIEKKAHPEADKLNIVTFKLSEEEKFSVVCGATNVSVGMKAAFAPIGTTLPIGLTLEPRKIRGILSEGMLCSEEELGLSESSSGILELPAEAPLGVSLETLWNEKEDILFDIDNKSLTHRPDLWGHYGMAREFSALYKCEFDKPFEAEWVKGIESSFNSNEAPIKVTVDKGSSCHGYYGLSLDNIKVEDSPLWLKERLSVVGLRPINNIVDISNYVMLELGMPLHIFDRELIKGNRVTIKEVGKETLFTTLDETERVLLPDDTVICDEEKPLVLAGIMGGLNSGVHQGTTKIFLEVANWQAARVRKTSTRLGLRTDSSMRYEKTLDSQLLYRTLLRTVELIKKLCPDATVIGGPQYDGEEQKINKSLTIKLSVENINRTLGADIPTKNIIDILERLDFKVTHKEGRLDVEVPSYRATKDIECDADIIEEVGRIIGYDNILPQDPLLNVSPVGLSPLHELRRKAQDFLSLHGQAFEVNTYPMVGEALLKRAHWPQSKLKLLNSLSVEQSQMRSSLIPSFLEVVGRNAKHFERTRFFEWARTYHEQKEGFASEKNILGIAYFDKEETQIVNLLNDVDRLCRYLNLPVEIVDKHPKFKNELVDEEWMGIHPFEFKNLRVMGKMKGCLLSIHPTLLKQFKIKGNVSMALIDMSGFEKRAPRAKVNYKPLPKFPSSRFDYTIAVTGEQSFGDIFATLKKIKLNVDCDHKLVTTYRPDQEGDITYVTLAAILSDSQKTLPGDEIKNCEEKIISSLKEAGFPLKEA